MFGSHNGSLILVIQFLAKATKFINLNNKKVPEYAYVVMHVCSYSTVCTASYSMYEEMKTCITIVPSDQLKTYLV